ncbi:MAG: endonuclease III [Synergistaceae bacterium]|jgi:endonuclease-3|nr:endonuclease III [Synergistaceae bacterium]
MLPVGKKTREIALDKPSLEKRPENEGKISRTTLPKNLGQWISDVLDLLESQWHNEEIPNDFAHSEPLDGLILTVLSQHTNDRNRDVAFSRLKDRYPAWEAAAAAGYEALEEAVRPAGLAPTKAKRILEILEIVLKDFGRYSILPLAEKGRDEARKYLLSLPGVGEKTAACVLLFDMGLPAFPVDTHIARVCQRVGFVPDNTPAETICALLERQVDSSRYLGGHINIIQHGRAVCKARNPLCRGCVAAGLCSFYGKQTFADPDAQPDATSETNGKKRRASTKK